MPSVLVIETGAIVPSANSFIGVADVTAFLTARNAATAWVAATQAQQEAAILFGGDYLKNEERFRYIGSRISSAQTMPWPRQDAKEYRGQPIATNEIPWRMKEAQVVASAKAFVLGDLQPDLAHGGMVKSEKVDVIETTYMDGASPEDVIVAIMGILRPLLVKTINAPTPYQAVPANLSPFADDEFTTPGL